MALHPRVGQNSSVLRAFMTPLGERQVLNMVKKLTGDPVNAPQYSYDYVMGAFRNLAEAMDLDLSQPLPNYSTPLILFSRLIDNIDPQTLGLPPMFFANLKRELEFRRINDDGAGDRLNFADEEKDAAEVIRVLSTAPLARQVWNVLDGVISMAWKQCRPQHDERVAFLMAMKPDMATAGPSSNLPLRNHFVGRNVLQRVNPRGPGAGGVMDYDFHPSELADQKVLSEVFSYLPTEVEKGHGKNISAIKDCAEAARTTLDQYTENVVHPKLKEFLQEARTYLVIIVEAILNVFQQGQAPPRMYAEHWHNIQLPLVMGISEKIYPLKVLRPHLNTRLQKRQRDIAAASSAASKRARLS